MMRCFKKISFYCLFLCLIKISLANASDSIDAPRPHPNEIAKGQIQRVASINICTDLLLYQLAPEKITSLSFLVLEEDYSTVVSEVASSGIEINRARASELLRQKPDLILASVYSSAQKINFLKSLGLNIWQLGSPITLEDSYQEIMDIATVLGVPERGQVLVTKMKQKASQLSQQLALKNKPDSRPKLVSLSPNKHVTGAANLMHDTIEKSGYENLGASLTQNYWSKKSLESLVLLKPDAWLIGVRYGENDPRNKRKDYDKANEYLSHRALARVVDKSHVLVLENNLSSCFGMQTVDAIEQLMIKMDSISH